ncbi:preprotein translocase subunit YajC [Luteimicrobium subarcticum]|uniref:Preprotein translocase subunit YajC n=1 Tax=Luteimicrobium subarcticum TaxID=620910 RepID=A0A2M8W407_9MICO|nr:preprotein translocase subunit YajC [Luteimicrobium subarcticum]PJI85648.1 preprotein translocase subunit YajC [Luteimicrobium subarcticum]
MHAITVVAESQQKSGSGNFMLLAILAILFVGVFFMSSRTRKAQKKQQEFRSTLTPGQEVMTASGMLGTVVAVSDDEITIESTPGTQSRWVRAAISRVIEPTVEQHEPAAEGVSASTAAGAETAPAGFTEQRALDKDVLEIPDDLSGLPEADRKDGDDGKPSTK